MSDIWSALSWALGLEAETLTVWQMSLRALITFVAGLAMVRIGEKRFLGKSTAFDVLLSIIIGSVLGSAVTGSVAFFPALGASVVLVGLHWLFAALAVRSRRFGTLLKGDEKLLVEDGEILFEALKEGNISEKDLLGALRKEAELTEPSEVKAAYLERTGDISVIPKSKAKLLEVSVEKGVQTVRISLE